MDSLENIPANSQRLLRHILNIVYATIWILSRLNPVYLINLADFTVSNRFFVEIHPLHFEPLRSANPSAAECGRSIYFPAFFAVKSAVFHRADALAPPKALGKVAQGGEP